MYTNVDVFRDSGAVPCAGSRVAHLRRLVLPLCIVALSAWGLPASVTAAPHYQPHEQMIMPDTLVPGGRVSISQFTSSIPQDDLLRQFEEAWTQPDAPPPMRSQRDGWQVITHLDGPVIESVELRRQGPGVQGRRVRWTPDEKAAGTLADDARWFGNLLPKTATALPAITHVDGGHRVSTFVATTDDSVVRLDNWIGRRLERQGYRIIGGGPNASQPGSANQAGSTKQTGKDGLGDTRAVFYARDGEEVALTVSKQANRQFAVMHWRRA